jgi:conjugal transfer/type IV secretion protein DotA/TraY
MNTKRWLQGFILALASLPAMAADEPSLAAIAEAAKRPSDKSRQALVSIFGEVVNNPLAVTGGGSDTILANLFQMTNGALLVIGGLFACYVWWKKLSQVAHEGSIFGKQQTVWGPIRLVMGVATLVPTANGWALSQLLMLWAASLLGVGIANLGTDQAVEAFSDGQSMIVQPAMPNTISLARAVFEANLCMHTMNASQAMSAASGGFEFKNEYVQQIPLPNGFILRNPSMGKVCGGAGLDPKLLEATPQANQWLGGTIDTSPIYKAHLAALNSMQQALTNEALKFVNASSSQLAGANTILPDTNQAIQSAALQYETSVNRQAGIKAGEIGKLAQNISQRIKSDGWWTLGAWYQTFAHANSKLTDAVSGKAQTYGEGLVGDPGNNSFRDAVWKIYKTQQSTDTNAVALGQTVSISNTDTNKLLASIFTNSGQRIAYYMTNTDIGGGGGGTTNPLIKMKNLGDYTLGAAETAVVVYAGAHVATSVSTGFNVAAFFGNGLTGLGDFLKGVLNAISPFFLMIIVPMLLVGLGLSVYLPLVPFIIWFGALINWLVVVLEAIVAAPLWAITHLGGEGEGFGARSAHGYIFLLNVMVRPILMVIGFFGGGALLVVGGTFLNEIYGVAVANVQFDSMTGLLSMAVILVIYFSICLTLIHSCFGLILIVPDQVINWVGGTAAATPGRESGDAVRNSVNVLLTKFEHMRRALPSTTTNDNKPGKGNGIKK